MTNSNYGVKGKEQTKLTKYLYFQRDFLIDWGFKMKEKVRYTLGIALARVMLKDVAGQVQRVGLKLR